MSGVIDLSKLPSPQVIESLSFQHIFDEMLEMLKTSLGEFDAVVESDPVWKLLEVAAFRELLLRARINDAAQSVMLAYASGANLNHLAALFGVERQMVNPGKPDAIPPIEPIFEADDRLRKRIQLSLEGHSSAGSIGSYTFHALAADHSVKDVAVASPSPGKVIVTILSSKDTGEPSESLIEKVSEKLNAKAVRPLTDWVVVEKAQIITYIIDALLIVEAGPDPTVIYDSAYQTLLTQTKQYHRLGQSIPLSGLYAALHQPGVIQVHLNQPTTDLIVAPHQAPWCSEIKIQVKKSDG